VSHPSATLPQSTTTLGRHFGTDIHIIDTGTATPPVRVIPIAAVVAMNFREELMVPERGAVYTPGCVTQ
jgi:hypothetical protein